jgi:hypothetical protein
MNSKFITSKVQMGPLLNTTGESDVHWKRRAPTCFSCQPATARRTDVCFLSLSSTDSRAVSRQNLATLAPTAPGFVVMPVNGHIRSVHKLSQRPNHKSHPLGCVAMSSSGGSSHAPASDRYGLLRRPAVAAWDQISEIGSASQADTTHDKFEFESNASNERPVLRPQTAGSRALPGLPRSAARPVVGGSAGRLRELSAQRPGSAPGGAHAESSLGLQQRLAREEAARVLADRPKSVEPDMLQHLAKSVEPDMLQHLALEESARALTDRPRSVDPDMLIGGAFVDQKSSFYGAVREYEKNLATLRKERDAMLDELTPLRRQLEDANISVRALEAERKQLLAVRERSTAAAGALHETIEKLAEMQRRTRSLEKQVQDNDADWKQERQRLTSRAEAAERRSAELASNIALHERAALSQNEAAATDAKRIQAQHSKQYEALEEQVRRAQKSLKDAQVCQCHKVGVGET